MKNPSKSLILSKALITLAFITVLTLLTFLPAANANPFLDVRQGSALETMVNEMVEKGIISGYPDGTFKPEQTINRAEALKIIFLASMITLNDQSLLTNLPFSDINTKEWYAPYIALAKLKNIVQGYPDGRFRPEQDVNRAEFIKMAMAAQRDYADDIAATDPIPFTDIDLQQWYAPYVIYGLQRNLIPKQSKLNPTGNMSRQNAVEIIYAVSHYNDERVKWENFDPNNPGEEYFNEITPYEPTSIPEDQIKITELPDGRKLIESFTSGYQLTVDKKTEVFTTAFEANTVKLSKGSCYTVISQDATNQNNLHQYLENYLSEYFGSTAEEAPEIQLFASSPQEFYSITWEQFGGPTSVLYTLFEGNVISILATDEQGDCLDLKNISQQITPL